MTKNKIKRDTIIMKLVNEGKTTREIAKEVGTSKTTVLNRIKKIGGATTKHIIKSGTTEVVSAHQINAFDQLKKINTDANAMLETLMKDKKPQQLALSCMAEIRGQLDMQLKIMATLFDLHAAQEFQQEIIEAIGEAAPDVRDRIINNLQKKRALRELL